MKKGILMTLMLMLTFIVKAQEPIHFTSNVVTHDNAEAEILFTGEIGSGWHVYSTDLGNEGPISATFTANKLDGVELVGKLQAVGNEINKYDKLFDMQLRFFENKVQFVQKVRFTKPTYSIDAYLEYGACNDQNCLPPSQVDIKRQGKAPQFVAPTAAKKNGKKGTGNKRPMHKKVAKRTSK